MPRDTSTRAGRRASRGAGLHQLPWRNLRNPYKPIEVLAEEQIVEIENASFDILERHGMELLHEEAVALVAAAGAELDGNRARFDRSVIRHWVSQTPSEFVLHARNPEHNLTVGGNHLNLATVGSAPNVSDLDGGRRPGNFEDFSNLVRLAQAFNAVHMLGGYPVEPIDLPAPTRHLDAVATMVRLSDKVPYAYALGEVRMADGLEIIRIGRGVSPEQFAREPSTFTVVNTNSPLRLDGPMLGGLMTAARLGQPVVVTPFTLAGAMAPASVAGALALQNAEALAGLAIVQMASPGAPAMYGGFTSNVDMRSGAPAFGTPEYTKAALIGGQLARRYRIPYRSSNANAANSVDAQAAYESQMSIWGATMGHVNLMLHGFGWMEGGLVASFEKFVLDVEMLQMMGEFLTPLRIDSDELAVDAIGEVGPGGHFFGSQHTLDRYETAFYAPIISNWQNFENWQLAGAVTADRKANQIWKQVLAEFEPPPLEEAVAAELEDFVERRRLQGGFTG
jgi:trimethylamine---corrinoid protein Co-methyltransferase